MGFRNPQGVCYLGGMQAKHSEMQRIHGCELKTHNREKQEVSRPVLQLKEVLRWK